MLIPRRERSNLVAASILRQIFRFDLLNQSLCLFVDVLSDVAPINGVVDTLLGFHRLQNRINYFSKARVSTAANGRPLHVVSSTKASMSFFWSMAVGPDDGALLMSALVGGYVPRRR